LILATIISFGSIAQDNINSNSAESYTDPILKGAVSVAATGQIKAERNFLKLNKEAKGVQWYEIDQGYAAYYTKDGHKGKSYYDTKGRFLWSILSYDEKYLPRDVVNQVKSAHYLNYRITQASEIRHYLEPGHTIYLLQITNDKVWKKVRIIDGDMETVEEFPVR